MMDSPCIQEIIDLTGLKKKNLKKSRREGNGGIRREAASAKMKKAVFTKATTTPLVRLVFESFFKDQIADSESSLFN